MLPLHHWIAVIIQPTTDGRTPVKGNHDWYRSAPNFDLCQRHYVLSSCSQLPRPAEIRPNEAGEFEEESEIVEAFSTRIRAGSREWAMLGNVPRLCFTIASCMSRRDSEQLRKETLVYYQLFVLSTGDLIVTSSGYRCWCECYGSLAIGGPSAGRDLIPGPGHRGA